MFRLFIKEKLKQSGITPGDFTEVADRAKKLGVDKFYGDRLVELGKEVDEGVRRVESHQARGEHAQAAIAARRAEEAIDTIIEIGKVGKS